MIQVVPIIDADKVPFIGYALQYYIKKTAWRRKILSRQVDGSKDFAAQGTNTRRMGSTVLGTGRPTARRRRTGRETTPTAVKSLPNRAPGSRRRRFWDLENMSDGRREAWGTGWLSRMSVWRRGCGCDTEVGEQLVDRLGRLVYWRRPSMTDVSGAYSQPVSAGAAKRAARVFWLWLFGT